MICLLAASLCNKESLNYCNPSLCNLCYEIKNFCLFCSLLFNIYKDGVVRKVYRWTPGESQENWRRSGSGLSVNYCLQKNMALMAESTELVLSNRVWKGMREKVMNRHGKKQGYGGGMGRGSTLWWSWDKWGDRGGHEFFQVFVKYFQWGRRFARQWDPPPLPQPGAVPQTLRFYSGIEFLKD